MKNLSNLVVLKLRLTKYEDRTFILWREPQTVTFNEEDMTADRISAFRLDFLRGIPPKLEP